MLQISKRWRFLRELSNQPFVRLAFYIWIASGIWDLMLAEWIPEEYARRLPRVYQVIATTIGLLSWQLWIVIGAIIVVVAILEYSFRQANKTVGGSPQSTSMQSTQSPSSEKSAPISNIQRPQVFQPARVEDPLPANAAFRIKERIFWTTPRKYLPDEAIDMRALLRELYNEINGPLQSIVASYAWHGNPVHARVEDDNCRKWYEFCP